MAKTSVELTMQDAAVLEAMTEDSRARTVAAKRIGHLALLVVFLAFYIVVPRSSVGNVAFGAYIVWWLVMWRNLRRLDS